MNNSTSPLPHVCTPWQVFQRHGPDQSRPAWWPRCRWWASSVASDLDATLASDGRTGFLPQFGTDNSEDFKKIKFYVLEACQFKWQFTNDVSSMGGGGGGAYKVDINHDWGKKSLMKKNYYWDLDHLSFDWNFNKLIEFKWTTMIWPKKKPTLNSTVISQ